MTKSLSTRPLFSRVGQRRGRRNSSAADYHGWAGQNTLSLQPTAAAQQWYEDAADKLERQPGAKRALFNYKTPMTDEENFVLDTLTEQGSAAPRDSQSGQQKLRTTVQPDLPSDAHVAACAAMQAMMRDGRWHQETHAYEDNAAIDGLLGAAKRNLFWTIKQKNDREAPKKCVLNIATMQAMVVRTYQRDIVEAGREMMDGKVSIMLPQLLHRYCKYAHHYRQGSFLRYPYPVGHQARAQRPLTRTRRQGHPGPRLHARKSRQRLRQRPVPPANLVPDGTRHAERIPPRARFYGRSRRPPARSRRHRTSTPRSGSDGQAARGADAESVFKAVPRTRRRACACRADGCHDSRWWADLRFGYDGCVRRRVLGDDSLEE